MYQVGKSFVLMLCGGLLYADIECLWRGYTHWTMFLLGGFMFLLIGCLNEWFPWEMPLILQGVIGAAAVTASELATGMILNIWLELGIWDYSQVPLNFLGQICLPYSLLWVLLAIFAVVLDDCIRYLLWGEKWPRYSFWRWKHE